MSEALAIALLLLFTSATIVALYVYRSGQRARKFHDELKGEIEYLDENTAVSRCCEILSDSTNFKVESFPEEVSPALSSLPPAVKEFASTHTLVESKISELSLDFVKAHPAYSLPTYVDIGSTFEGVRLLLSMDDGALLELHGEVNNREFPRWRFKSLFHYIVFTEEYSQRYNSK